MNKNKFITGKKAVALLSAIGVTATLLSPLALNTKVFANDETPQIASRTPGDAKENVPLVAKASISDYLNPIYYTQYNDKQKLLDVLKNIVENYDSQADVYEEYTIVVPSGFTLNKNNPIDQEIYDIMNEYTVNGLNREIYVCDDNNIENFQYSASIFPATWNENSEITFPKINTFLKSNNSVKYLFPEGTNIFVFDVEKIRQQFYSDMNEHYGITVNGRSLVTENGYFLHMNADLSEIKKPYSISLDSYDAEFIGVSNNLKKDDYYIFADQMIPSFEYLLNSSFVNTFDATDPDLLTYLERVYFKTDATNIEYNKDAKYLPASVFEMAKKYNKPVSLSFTENGKLEYSLTISEIKEIKDLNVQLTIKKLEGTDTPQFEFDFAHSGTLPGPMTVRAFVGYEYNAKTAYLYYKNADGQLEKQPSTAKVEAGYAEFVIDHCSTYVVSLAEIEGAIDNTQSTTPESDTEISTTPSVDSTTETDSNNNSSTGSTTGDTSTSGNTETTNKTKKESTVTLNKKIIPYTCNTTKNTVLLSSIAIAAVVLVGALVYKQKNIKA